MKATTQGPTGTAPLLLTIPAAARALSIGRSMLYELLARGEIETVRIGRARRIPMQSLEAYVERLSVQQEP